jgi:hypothetical protein
MPIKAGGVTGAARCASDWATQYKAAAWTVQTSSRGSPLVRHNEPSTHGEAMPIGALGPALPLGGGAGVRGGI